ncbi:MAG: hypothetical protein ACRDDY_19625 [Clostridium sp.]|uniref:hypothetical protein n=1 Tax=Clostridium sp. TaxID=1506 RepID=UPI003EE54C8F
MKISELAIKEIRAEIDFNDNKIIIKNPRGKVKEELLLFFKKQVDINVENVNKKGKKKKTASDIDIFKTLIKKLTNIQIDTDDLVYILSNPSYEMSLVILYLSSIMQELIFEVLTKKNLEIRMSKNTLLEKDTLNMLNDLGYLVEEINHRKTIENGEKVQ